MKIILRIPASSKKLLMVSILEELTDKIMARSVKGIKKCAILDPNKENPHIRLLTEGINFYEIWKLYDVLDINNIFSNDLSEILKVYGIEAARNAMIKEISSVFQAYDIKVNFRHLSLIADYSTFEGSLKAMNRIGINSNVSPFLKMSFETTMKFIQDSTLNGYYDDTSSPSSQIVLGLPTCVGTGSFDILYNIQE